MKRVTTLILALLVLFNVSFIFYQSLQDGEASSSASATVSGTVADIVVPDLPQRPIEEQNTVMEKIAEWTRTAAHAIEFAGLGFFLTLFLLLFSKTEHLPAYYQLPLSWLSCLLIALIDETVQIFVDGRAFELKDIGTDGLGALFGVAIAFGAFSLLRLRSKKRT